MAAFYAYCVGFTSGILAMAAPLALARRSQKWAMRPLLSVACLTVPIMATGAVVAVVLA
jgi:hypothetical protein